MTYMRIQTMPFNLTILNVYAPIIVALEDEKDKLHKKLEEKIELLPKVNMVIILGNFNE